MKGNYSLWNNVSYLLRGIWDSDRKLLLFMALEAFCMVLTPWTAMYLPKIGVDLVAGEADTFRAVWWILGATAAVVLSQTLGTMASRGKGMRVNRLRSYYRMKLFSKTLECDYAHVEDPKWQDKYMQAKLMSVDWGQWSATTFMTEGAVQVCSGILSFFLYASVIASVNPWILLLLTTLSGINFFAVRRAQSMEVARMNERAAIQKRFWYMDNRAGDTRLGKDLRLYEMGDWIRFHYHHYREAYFNFRKEVVQHHYHAALVEAFTLFFRDGAAWIYFLWEAANGNLTPGEFVLACNAVAAFSGLVTQVTGSFGKMAQAVPPLNRMRSYLESADEPDPDPAAKIPEAGEPVSIEFQDVSFAYQEKFPILSHFNLKIDAGEKIALVGVNGAGKTTMVKLLCGFYQADSGKILINGEDVRRYRKQDLYRLLAPVFQEAMILPFSIAENVSLQEAASTDKERVCTCLKQVGLWEKVNSLPNGMDTVMMHLERGSGGYLSGGQQQKLLMARAMYKDAPVLFFDEPTAALDPIAESETYRLFHDLSGRKTAVFISHRLASTRFCDRVILLENGKAAACGSHEELLESCPVYAQMYEMQSRYYKRGEEGQV